MEKAKTANRYSTRCVRARCEWCWSMGQITPRNGPRSARLRQRSAAQGETLRGWVRQAASFSPSTAAANGAATSPASAAKEAGTRPSITRDRSCRHEPSPTRRTDALRSAISQRLVLAPFAHRLLDHLLRLRLPSPQRLQPSRRTLRIYLPPARPTDDRHDLDLPRLRKSLPPPVICLPFRRRRHRRLTFASL